MQSISQQLIDAATNGGELLNQAFTAASGGDAGGAANLIQQAQAAFAPILSQGGILQPPAKPYEPGK